MFLNDLNNNADFSNVKKYIANELQNPNSVSTVNTPGFSPLGSLKKNISKTATLAGIGTAKYVKDNKLNRRQRKQADKWANLFSPPKPKQNFLSSLNPFRKKQPITTTATK